MSATLEINGKLHDAAAVEEILYFLDRLRESGKTNMLVAVPFMVDEFPDLEDDGDDSNARDILKHWMGARA